MAETAWFEEVINYNMTRSEVEVAGGNPQWRPVGNEYGIVRVLDSFDLCLNPSDASLTPSIISHGYWESWITSWMTRWIRPGMTFIDVGANCGYYTMLAESLVGPYGKVYAFEPNPVYHKLLKKTRELNNANFGLDNRALSDTASEAVLYVPKYLHGSASMVGDIAGYETTKVDIFTARMDDYFLYGHDIIKIDAEGAEEMIFDGAYHTLNDDKHTTLILEYTPGSYSNRFLRNLSNWGTVSLVNFDGGEEPIDFDFLDADPEWKTLSVRRK